MLAQDLAPEQGAELLAQAIGGGLLLAVALGVAVLLSTRSPRGISTLTVLASVGVVVCVVVVGAVMLRSRSGDAGAVDAAWGVAATAVFVVLARWTWRAEQRRA